MGLIDRITDPIAKRSATKILTGLNDLHKADSSALVTPASQTGILRYTFDPVYVNGNYYNKKKPDSTITFDVLRNFSLKYEIVRACINLRRRQLSGMEWDIVTAETADVNPNDKDILAVKEFFMNLGGNINPETGEIVGGSYRKFLNMIVEDIMALDALALYNWRSNGGDLLTLLPVDGSTIRLVVGNMGQPPLPPEVAYKQIIRGTVTAELTTDDLRYLTMNPRTNSPYGLSPLESLMITVSSALKSGMYNLEYLTDGNIPEGLVEAPAQWTAAQIKEFEKNWDAALAGDAGATRKLHWLPAGSKYAATKKPDDMAFETFGLWLMQLTCAVFDVQPIDIGFPPKGGLGGKGFGEHQKDSSNDKGLRPIANLIEELFNELIQVELGYTHLRFSFTGLDSENLREAAETNQTLIFSGQRTPNEVRTDDGLDPINGGDALFVVGQAMPLNQEAVDAFGTAATGAHADNFDPNNPEYRNGSDESAGEARTRADAGDKKPKTQFDDDGSAGDSDSEMNMSQKTDEAFIRLVTELRTLRKFAKNRFAKNKPMTPFDSNVLPKSVIKEINSRLSKAVDFDQADGIIKEYMTDYQIDFIHKVNKLREDLGVVI